VILGLDDEELRAPHRQGGDAIWVLPRRIDHPRHADRAPQAFQVHAGRPIVRFPAFQLTDCDQYVGPRAGLGEAPLEVPELMQDREFVPEQRDGPTFVGSHATRVVAHILSFIPETLSERRSPLTAPAVASTVARRYWLQSTQFESEQGPHASRRKQALPRHHRADPRPVDDTPLLGVLD
jgi:hypothetical protein